MNYKIHHFKSLTSTQDKAKEFAKRGLSNIVVVSGIQTKGRGRFKRKWHSGKGGLWMSILLRPEKTENLQYLTFAAAVSVAEATKKIANLKTNIKWTNDVHYRGKKLCGILTEGTFGKKNFVIVGIGLNVNQIKLPGEIKSAATSLRMIKHRFFHVQKIMTAIINRFFYMYNKYYTKNKTDKILNSWKKYCDTINKNAVVTAKAKKLGGKVIGIDKNCSLLLKTKNNKIIKIIEGDVRIRY